MVAVSAGWTRCATSKTWFLLDATNAEKTPPWHVESTGKSPPWKTKIKLNVILMMTVAETLHFAIMVCAISATNVKTAGTESTEHVALVEQLRREILAGNLQRENPAKRSEKIQTKLT